MPSPAIRDASVRAVFATRIRALEVTGGTCLPSECRDWIELDDSPATTSISAGNGTVYQLHQDGSIWESTGVPCTNGTSCPGWTELDDNQATVQISVSNDSSTAPEVPLA